MLTLKRLSIAAAVVAAMLVGATLPPATPAHG